MVITKIVIQFNNVKKNKIEQSVRFWLCRLRVVIVIILPSHRTTVFPADIFDA